MDDFEALKKNSKPLIAIVNPDLIIDFQKIQNEIMIHFCKM